MPRQNLFVQSSDLTHASWTRADLSAVTALGNVGPAGAPAFRLTDNAVASGYHALVQSVAGLTVGRVVTCSVFVRAGTKSRISIQSSSGSIAVVYNVVTLQTWVGGGRMNEITGSGCEPVGDGWVRCWVSYVVGGSVPAGHNIYMIDIDGLNIPSYTGDGTGTIDLAAPMITETKSPPSEIVTGTTAINEGAPRGRGPRQNLLVQSSSLATGWTQNGITLATGAAIAPDKTTTANLITETAANTTHSIGRTVAVLAGRPYTFSAYVKRADATARPILVLGNGGNIQATFDVVGGSPLGFYNPLGIPMQQGAEHVGDGWFRLWVTFTTSTDQNFSALVYPTDGTSPTAVGSSSFAGDTSKGFLLWGPQLVEGAGPGEYVATGATVVNEGAPRGLTVGQNLTSSTADLTSGAWIKGTLSANANADGSFDLVDASAAVTGSLLKYALGVPAAEVRADYAERSYTLRFKVAKTTGGTQPTFYATGLGGMAAYIETDTGSVLSSTACVVEVAPELVASVSYWRVSITWKPYGTTSPWFYFYPAWASFGSTVQNVAATCTARVRDVSFTNANEPNAPPATYATEAIGRAARSRMKRQNLFAQSEDLTVAPWGDVAGGMNVAASTEADPFGGAVTRLSNSTKNGFRTQTPAYKGRGVTYTFAALLKFVSGSGYILLRHSGTWAAFNVKDGAVGTHSGSMDIFGDRVLASGIESIGSGWYHCWYTYHTPGPGNYVGFNATTAAIGAAANDWEMLVGRVQLTEGGYGAPYVKTTTTAIDEGPTRGRPPGENLLTNSEGLGAAPWVVQAGTVITSSGLGPTGHAANLVDLTATAANQGVYAYAGEAGFSSVAIPGRTYTRQVYLKAGTASDVGKTVVIADPVFTTGTATVVLSETWQLATLTEPFGGGVGSSTGLWIRKAASNAASTVLVSAPAITHARGGTTYTPTDAGKYASNGYSAPRGA